MSKFMKKIVLPFALAVMLLVSACATQTPTAQPTNPAEPTEAVVMELTAEPIVIVDVIGREVTLQQPASKLTGTHNPTLNAAAVVGGGGKYLVGFGDKSMGRGLYEQVIEGFDDLPEVGKGSNINVESVIASGADLVILPERHQDLVPQFEAANIPVLVILDSTESFETVKQTLKLLGMAVGENEKAEKINAFIDSQINNAQTLSLIHI